MNPIFVDLVYLAVSVLFIVGIKMLATPKTAVKGNVYSGLAMLAAVAITLAITQVNEWPVFWAAVALGSLLGWMGAHWVKMTAIPQMVALFNGLGGLSSLLVGTTDYLHHQNQATPLSMLVVLLSVLVGGITFSGSLVAMGKLQAFLPSRPVLFPLQKTLNLFFLLVSLALVVCLMASPLENELFYYLTGLSLLLGVLAVMPIGGADMPVVVALLNSYSGIAVSFTGFVLNNKALIITGSLVGASGIFLTRAMCKAMNRSLTNVLFSGFGATAQTAGAGAAVTGTIKQCTVQDATLMMDGINSLIVVPGFGMAAAQAQHAVREFAKALEAKGVNVRYAIHPVAGRMPGHMNVLLAEANVPYDQLYDLDQINEDFKNTDVTLVVGANDVVNPAAKEDRTSPLYGMPILNADQSRLVIVLKRSMNPGFSGVENNLFYKDNTLMLFGDAKKVLSELAVALKE